MTEPLTLGRLRKDGRTYHYQGKFEHKKRILVKTMMKSNLRKKVSIEFVSDVRDGKSGYLHREERKTKSNSISNPRAID